MHLARARSCDPCGNDVPAGAAERLDESSSSSGLLPARTFVREVRRQVIVTSRWRCVCRERAHVQTPLPVRCRETSRDHSRACCFLRTLRLARTAALASGAGAPDRRRRLTRDREHRTRQSARHCRASIGRPIREQKFAGARSTAAAGRTAGKPLGSSRYENDRARSGQSAYVFLDDGRFVNEWMLREGLARASPRSGLRRSRELLAAEAAAQSSRRGIWEDVRRP